VSEFCWLEKRDKREEARQEEFIIFVRNNQYEEV
jgi:hypothetical protein